MVRSINGCLRTRKIFFLLPLIFAPGCFAAPSDTASALDTLQVALIPSFLKSDTQKQMPPVPIKREKVTSRASFKLPGAARLGILLLSITLIGIVIWFVGKKNRPSAFLSTTRLSVMDKEVQKTCRYIEKNYAKTDLSVEMICCDLVTGKAFLEALFEKELGLTVGQFMTYVRINRARIFIENNLQANAETVGGDIGFATPETFTAAFKKIVGTSFEEYRELRAKREAMND